MSPQTSAFILRIRARYGTVEAQRQARELGYAVRWDRKGNMYVRDLLEA